MNSLFFVVTCGALSALSLTAAVTHLPLQVPSKVQAEARLPVAFALADIFKSHKKTLFNSYSELEANSNSKPNSLEEFNQFLDHYDEGVSVFFSTYRLCYTLISNHCKSAAGFNASITQEVEKLVRVVGNELYHNDYDLFMPGGIEWTTPMPQVALKFRDFFVDNKKIVVMNEESIERLIGKENLNLVGQVQAIYASAEVLMEAAFQPTLDYLEKFLTK